MSNAASPRVPWGARLPFFYGWLMLPVAMLVSICTSPGQTYGISVFNPFLRQDLELSASQLSGAYMLGTLLASLPLTWIGALMDRHGARKTLTGVVLVFGLTCLGMSQVSGLGTLFVAFFFLRLLGQGSMGLLAGNTLAMWFHRRLGLASGISHMGGAIAMGTMPALSLFLIQLYGWRATYALLGLGVCAVLLPLLALVFRNRPEDIGLHPDGMPTGATARSDRGPGTARAFSLAAALRTRAYWFVVAGMASWSMTGTGIQFHIVPIFVGRGLGAADAAAMFSVYAAVIAAVRLGGGALADRVPLNLLLGGAVAAQALGMFLLNVLPASYLPLVFPCVFALGSGLLMAVSETVWARYYGRAHLGKIRGSVTTIGVAALGLGPFVMGVAFDLFGGFAEVLWAFICLTIPLTVLALMATPPKEA